MSACSRSASSNRGPYAECVAFESESANRPPRGRFWRQVDKTVLSRCSKFSIMISSFTLDTGAVAGREQAVGLLVADDLLLLAVPDELAAQQVGEVAEVAQRGGAVADLDVHGRAGVPSRMALNQSALWFMLKSSYSSVRGARSRRAGTLKLMASGSAASIGPFPFEDQPSLVAPEDVAELGLADLVARLAPDQASSRDP